MVDEYEKHTIEVARHAVQQAAQVLARVSGTKPGSPYEVLQRALQLLELAKRVAFDYRPDIRTRSLHPSARSLLRWFDHHDHPAYLQRVVWPFSELAYQVAQRYSCPETSAAVRKLLEAKDCAVRAAISAREADGKSAVGASAASPKLEGF